MIISQAFSVFLSNPSIDILGNPLDCCHYKRIMTKLMRRIIQIKWFKIFLDQRIESMELEAFSYGGGGS